MLFQAAADGLGFGYPFPVALPPLAIATASGWECRYSAAASMRACNAALPTLQPKITTVPLPEGEGVGHSMQPVKKAAQAKHTAKMPQQDRRRTRRGFACFACSIRLRKGTYQMPPAIRKRLNRIPPPFPTWNTPQKSGMQNHMNNPAPAQRARTLVIFLCVSVSYGKPPLVEKAAGIIPAAFIIAFLIGRGPF